MAKIEPQPQQLHKNFYENIDEANLRMQGTIATYDGDPMYIHVITNHKPDGAFRVYMSPVEDVGRGMVIPPLSQFNYQMPQMGQELDKYVDGTLQLSNGAKLIRKRMDSSLFNKFRPFPMGMMNYGGRVYFLERRPDRPSTKQGLIPKATVAYEIDGFGASKSPSSNSIIYSQEFSDCVKGDYPSPKECIKGLLDGNNKNKAVAFDRNFALLKGPIDTLFLAYKGDIVASLPNSDFSEARLAKKYAYVKEAIADLNLFIRVI